MADQSSGFAAGFFWGCLAIASIAYVLHEAEKRSLSPHSSACHKYDPEPVQRYSKYKPRYDNSHVADYDPGYQRRIQRIRQYQPIYSTYPFYPRPHRPQRAIRRIVPPPCYMPCEY